MANLHRLLLAAALTLVASLAVVSSASAAPGSGADVRRLNECTSYSYGTFCIDAKYVQNLTETPSGNVSYLAIGKSAFTFTGEGYLQGCTNSSSSDFNYHYLIKDDYPHEQGSRQNGETLIDCLGYQRDCTYSYDYHYVNGELQFVRPEFNCNP